MEERKEKGRRTSFFSSCLVSNLPITRKCVNPLVCTASFHYFALELARSSKSNSKHTHMRLNLLLFLRQLLHLSPQIPARVQATALDRPRRQRHWMRRGHLRKEERNAWLAGDESRCYRRHGIYACIGMNLS